MVQNSVSRETYELWPSNLELLGLWKYYNKKLAFPLCQHVNNMLLIYMKSSFHKILPHWAP